MTKQTGAKPPDRVSTSLENGAGSAVQLLQTLEEENHGADVFLLRLWIVLGYGFWPGAVVSALMRQRIDMLLFALLGISSELTRMQLRQIRGAQLAAATADVNMKWLPALAELLDETQGEIQTACRLRIRRLLRTLSEVEKGHLDAGSLAAVRRILGPARTGRDRKMLQHALRTIERQQYLPALPEARRLCGAAYPVDVRNAARRTVDALSAASALQPAQNMPSAAEQERTVGSEAGQEATAPPAEHAQQQDGSLHRRYTLRSKVLTASYAVFTPFGLYNMAHYGMQHQYLPAVLGGGLALLPLLLGRYSVLGRQIKELKALARSRDVSAVGPLADALLWPDRYARKMAVLGLQRLLPQMKLENAALLSQARYDILYQWLDMGLAEDHCDFLLAILNVLQRMGNITAVVPVERLAYSEAVGPEQGRVKEAARVCLLALPSTAEKSNAAVTLLRASSAENAMPETLLRTTLGSDAGSLLRPNNLHR